MGFSLNVYKRADSAKAIAEEVVGTTVGANSFAKAIFKSLKMGWMNRPLRE
jgi:hypothetical protein